MPGNPPTVSVLIPTYNGEVYIRAALESVLSQTLDDVEVVVADDGSTDGTVDMVATIRDPRIRLLAHQADRGLGANWNRCLREARGTFVKLLPQDDLLAPTALSRQVGVLQGDAAARLALTFSARTIIGPGGKPLFRRGWGREARVVTRKDVVRRLCRLGTNPIGEPGAVLFRRSLAKRAGPFDAQRSFAIDIDYWLRLLEHGNAAYLPEPLCSFRVSSHSQSVRTSRSQAREFSAFLRELGQRSPRDATRAEIFAGNTMSLLNAGARAALYFMTIRPGGRR